MVSQAVRVRFAPSPTGYLHVGGARTALFNWLYARNTGGQFVLRIEDTDTARSTEEAVKAIFDGMTWLGLTWDEGPGAAEPNGPSFQTQRLDYYNKYVDQLLASGHAFKCYMTPEELDAKRQEATGRGEIYRYDRRWALDRPAADIAADDAAKKPFVVRFKSPAAGIITIQDIVHGEVNFDVKEMVDDFVIVKKDGIPTYNFAVVIDDATMFITHVIRGDDHLSNTPKQIALYQALGLPVPLFGHIPMILGPDKVKLSKRHGAVSVMQYAEEGYLPHAVLNYLVRLGWSHGDQELFEPDEMIRVFDLDGLNKTAAVFDVAKLEWVNAHYMKAADPADLVKLMMPFWAKAGLPAEGRDAAWLQGVVRSLQERARTLVQMADASRFYFDVPVSYDEAALAKHLTPDNRAMLADLRTRLEGVSTWDEATLEPLFKEFATERGLKLGGVIQPTRVAVTGTAASPGMYEVLALLGRDLSLARMAGALAQPANP